MTDTLRLEHDVRAPRHARHWLVRLCHEWHCDDLADSAALIISELVTNVFLHARTDCMIHAAFDSSTLTVTVSDGDGRELSLHSLSTTAEDGRGLAIVAGLADAWGTRLSGPGKIVWFQLSITDQPRN